MIHGDGLEEVIRAVYPELREMAARLLRGERENHTLQRTALVHEAFLRLFGNRSWEKLSPESFLALAAHQMRNILIDYGRRHRSQKRGREFTRVPLLGTELASMRDEASLVALNTALKRLARLDKRAHSVVELKFFGGFTNQEAAAILNVSDATVEADWQFARAWLFEALVSNYPKPARGAA